MSNYRIILILLLVAFLGATTLYLKKNRYILLSFRFKGTSFENEDGNKLLYRFYKPDVKSGEKYPLVIYLHGGGQGGNDNLKQLDRVPAFFTSSDVQKKYPSFVIAPQCPSGVQWVNTTFKSMPFDHYDQSKIRESPEFTMLLKLIDQLCKQYPIDKNRIYMAGFSMGSSGTWDFISRHPEIIAAAVPISGVSDTSTVKKILNIPIWAFHGENDDIAPVRLNRDMYELINKAGGNCKLTIFENNGHGCVKKTLNYPGLADWVFSQRKTIQN
jgi:predicted peptidase